MADEDSHSIDSSVSVEEGHSDFKRTQSVKKIQLIRNIALTHTFFVFLRTRLLSNAGYASKLHKFKMLEKLSTFVVKFAYFCIRPN